MAASLLQLMEELLESIEQRDAGDPDAPAWEACARIQRLEAELAGRLGERTTATGTELQRVAEVSPADEAYAAIA